MNEHLPYERLMNDLLSGLPLPNEDMAWADMLSRLEKKKKRRIFFWWRPGCGLLFLTLIVTLTLLLFLDPFFWFSSKEPSEKSSGQNELVQPPKTIHSDSNTHISNEIVKSHLTDSITITNGDDSEFSVKKSRHIVDQVNIHSKPSSIKSRNKNKPSEAPEDQIKPIIDLNKRKELPSKELSKTDSTGFDSAGNSLDTSTQILPDSIAVDTLIKEPVAENKIEDKTDSSSSKTFWSAGMAVFQQVPVSGQSLTSFNSLGRKGIITDYIPAIYVRLNKKDSWFIQGGFRYGAPQQTKEQIYIQTKFLDTVGVNDFTNTTSYRLKKTFYHQLPISFNYFVLPDLSIGSGIIWNKFSSAVAEREVIQTHNVTLNDSLLALDIVRDRGDSLFTKSFFQVFFESQYKWKRFSVGARYAFGLQPYIKFTLPGSSPVNEKNSSLQIFIRYELWKQKEKD